MVPIIKVPSIRLAIRSRYMDLHYKFLTLTQKRLGRFEHSAFELCERIVSILFPSLIYISEYIWRWEPDSSLNNSLYYDLFSRHTDIDSYIITDGCEETPNYVSRLPRYLLGIHMLSINFTEVEKCYTHHTTRHSNFQFNCPLSSFSCWLLVKKVLWINDSFPSFTQ